MLTEMEMELAHKGDVDGRIQKYHAIVNDFHQMLKSVQRHLSAIEDAKFDPVRRHPDHGSVQPCLAYLQLVQTPRLQEVATMLMVSLEKLFQAVEYCCQPIKQVMVAEKHSLDSLGLDHVQT